MEPVYTTEQMRRIDAAAPEPVEVLIERAGAAVARAARRMLGGTYGRRVVVIAGTGNNGADGRVAARLLARQGVAVRIVAASATPRPVTDADLVIDAAYGTGFRGTWTPPEVRGIPVLAVDIPSGVQADTGAVTGPVLRATRTVTFHGLKPGLLLGPGSEFAGAVEVVDIGLPLAHPHALAVGADGPRRLWVTRPADAHKWRQAVRIVAGSPSMPGAAVLCAGAAQRAGSGMVQLCSPGQTVAGAPVTVVQRPLTTTAWSRQAMEELDRIHALAIGPGMGRTPETLDEIRRLVAEAPCPTVVDGDGLFALASGGPSALDGLRARTAPTVLTPHDGEFTQLAGEPPGEDRLAAARHLAERTGAVVLLKGPCTVVAAPSGTTVLVTEGDQRLATAGSGDVLTGIIAAGLAGGLSPLRAAFVGAWLHGATLRSLPAHGVVASDLIDALPAALALVAGS